MHTTMYTIADSQNPPYDLFLIQEPWWKKYGTVSFLGWQAILPKLPLRDNKRPWVVAFYRQNSNLDVTLRCNIITDPNTMILDIKKEGSDKAPT